MVIRLFTISQFPEVYHDKGISKAAIFAPARRVTGQRRGTTYSGKSRWKNGTYCVSAPLSAGGHYEDPEPEVFGSGMKKSEGKLNYILITNNFYVEN
ncbi:hypothetical protein V5L74_003533 [Enterobacter hormaechei]